MLQLLVAGLTVGSGYALVALGIHIILRATRIINFAQGEFVIVGGLFALTFVQMFHLNPWLALLGATMRLQPRVGLGMQADQCRAPRDHHPHIVFGVLRRIRLPLAVLYQECAQHLWVACAQNIVQCAPKVRVVRTQSCVLSEISFLNMI